MFNIRDNATWNNGDISPNISNKLGHGPFKIVSKELDSHVTIEYTVTFKRRRKTKKVFGTAIVPSRLLKKV